MIRTRHRVGRAIISALLAAAILAGCVTQLPFTESFETAIPKALLESDLGITEAHAGTLISGLSVSLSVVVVFDRETVTADELSELFAIIVEHNNLSNPLRLHVTGLFGTTPESREYLPLASLGEELGFPAESDGHAYFEANWDDVVEFVRE